MDRIGGPRRIIADRCGNIDVVQWFISQIFPPAYNSLGVISLIGADIALA